jgi:hypothetical protein
MLLDSGGFVAEVSGAAFQQNEKLVLADTIEHLIEEEEFDTVQFLPGKLAIYDIGQMRSLSEVIPESTIGTVMPIGSRFVVGFYEHPKLIDLETGKLLYQWAELNSGTQYSSILWTTPPVPPLALDPANSRFALADDKAIHVIQIAPDAFLDNG